MTAQKKWIAADAHKHCSLTRSVNGMAEMWIASADHARRRGLPRTSQIRVANNLTLAFSAIVVALRCLIAIEMTYNKSITEKKK